MSRRVAFEAAHAYGLPDLTAEENRCLFGPAINAHGHNYECAAAITGDVDPRTGIVLNITELTRLVKEVTDTLDHRFINQEHPYFQRRLPTCENLAAFLWEALIPAVGSTAIRRVVLWESRELWATRQCGSGGEVMTTLTRGYQFSAAHRLHSLFLSDEENRELFGKCNNPHGHGHDYRIAVTVGGAVDERTGMLIQLDELDNVVREEVLERYHLRHLNHDSEDFARLNPTSENLVRVIWERLRARLGERLVKVGIHETDRNYFEYSGE